MTHVPRIKVPISDLNGERLTYLRTLFSGIAKRGNNIVVNQKSIGGHSYILGISDSYETGSDYLEWRFKTTKENYFGLYYERWKPFESDIYFLDRVYFHLTRYDSDSRQEKEYLLLHCDASEPDDTPHSLYKRSPHLHISVAEHPLPHSHIALNINSLPIIYKSLDSLQIAINDAITMIREEVIENLV
jgi:hypothetical protein